MMARSPLLPFSFSRRPKHWIPVAALALLGGCLVPSAAAQSRQPWGHNHRKLWWFIDGGIIGGGVLFWILHPVPCKNDGACVQPLLTQP